MTISRLPKLLDYVDATYPRCREGIDEAMRVGGERFAEVVETALQWAEQARGPEAIERSVDAYAQFTTDVNMAQARYEIAGSYENKSYLEVYESHYSQEGEMSTYLWGIYLTNFLWAHHMEIWQKFDDEFVARLAPNAKLVEIAPGHGCWGAWALHKRHDASLRGYDISATAVEIASATTAAAGVEQRATYERRDALNLDQMPAESSDACICCFLVEHLEDPDQLFAVIYHLLKPGGLAFVTGALTAAQVDHIYEFHRESELVQMSEEHGLRVIQTLSANPKRLLRKAKFIPRSMLLLLEKPTSA